ncbi:hypothetical protein KY289_030045 [Solanum tuberosum]|nr:hypothetical protein KY289_030045 [Solanum tuberosum]
MPPTRSGIIALHLIWLSLHRELFIAGFLLMRKWITTKKFGKANIVESWRNIHYILEAEIHHRTTTIVQWIKPPNMSVKLNSDGSCIQGRSGGGVLIRNSLGNLMFAYYINWGLVRATSRK